MENWNHQKINSQYNKQRIKDGISNVLNPTSIRSGIEMVVLTSGYSSTTLMDTNDVKTIAEALSYQGHAVKIITCKNNHFSTHQCGITNRITVRKVNTRVPRISPHSFWNYILNGPCFLLNSALLALWMLIFFTTGVMMIPQNPQIVFICDTHPISVLILKCFGNFRIIYFHKFRKITITKGKIEMHDTLCLPQCIIRFCLHLSDEIVVENYASARLLYKVFCCKRQKILYPCVVTGRLLSEECGSIRKIIPKLKYNTHIILTYGPFNACSNFELAIDAFDLTYVKNNNCKYAENIKLVIAGNYNCSNYTEAEYYKYLVKYAFTKKSAEDILLLTNLSSVKKKTLLKYSLVVLHTCFNDISARQILEAMYIGTPVISAFNDVSKDYLPDEYGCLVKPTAECYSRAIIKLLDDYQMADEYGKHVKMHFSEHFSFSRFMNQLNGLIYSNSTENNCNECCQSIIECYSKLFED